MSKQKGLVDPADAFAKNKKVPNIKPGPGNEYLQYILETLDYPRDVNLEASKSRTELADRAWILPMALDAADSIQAQNSLEKMLAHQMAVCHDQAMRLMGKVNRVYKDSIEIQRLINCSVRLMNTYQQALHTLHKLRTGGRQTVIVQHQYVDVRGGQAVVAGNVETTGGEASRAAGGEDEK